MLYIQPPVTDFTMGWPQIFSRHNAGKVKSTKAFFPWAIIYFEEFTSLEEAIKRENFFKTATGRRFLNPIKLRSRVPRPND